MAAMQVEVVRIPSKNHVLLLLGILRNVVLHNIEYLDVFAAQCHH